jgi:hypothetical protein
MAKLAGLTAELLNVFYMMGFDTGIKILFSAYSTKFSLKFTAGALNQLQLGRYSNPGAGF